ncbi:hypothetical protein [Kibdelosporangium aridum]|uniref:PE-PGRS family protein n=1 Tax=Kibdelosporangium aridum TaxID=2030 RepID=A0A1W2EYN3_KIBAR|nr:hypothetical protein [Kibdelosporangium aridum]SMD14682.1 hypothetical protein SAMN05661093_05096 [Kibdelosporangium aridum]
MVTRPTTTPQAIPVTKSKKSAVANGAATKHPPPHTTARIIRERQAAAKQLVAELAIHSRIVLENVTEDEVAKLRRVIDFAKRNGLVPPGRYIEMKQRRRGTVLEIVLYSGRHPNTKHMRDGLPVVPMPTELRSLHPVVAALQNDRGRLAMPCSVRRRSLLFLHGLTREAVRRGYEVREEPVPEHYRYTHSDREHPGRMTHFRRDGELNIVIDGFDYTVTITQESPDTEVDDRWRRLVVSLPYRSPGRQYNWYDRKRVTIDDRIGAILDELETRAVEDRQHQLEVERQQAERRRQWEVAMERAHRRATEAYYASHLDDQVRAWQQMHDIQAYCDALELKIRDAGDDDQAAEARQWLIWARRYAAAIDPLRTLPTMPEAPEFREQDLEPYLDGWSPFGPEEPTDGRRH